MGVQARRRPGLRRDEGGAVVVEFAIVLPVLLAILIAVTELASYFWTRNTLKFAAEEAARTAMINTKASPAEVKATALAKLNTVASLDPGRLTVTAAVDPYGAVTFMAVTAQYAWPAKGITGLFPFDLGPAVGEARMPMVQ